MGWRRGWLADGFVEIASLFLYCGKLLLSLPWYCFVRRASVLRFVGRQMQGRLSIVCRSIIIYSVAVISSNFNEETHSWEADGFTSNREIPRILWNRKGHYFLYECTPLVAAWARRTRTVPSNAMCFFKIRFHMNLPFMATCFRWSLSFTLFHKNFVCISLPYFSW
jgi:hypothetical protein